MLCAFNWTSESFPYQLQQEPFNGQSTNFSGGGYSYSQGNGVSIYTKTPGICFYQLFI